MEGNIYCLFKSCCERSQLFQQVHSSMLQGIAGKDQLHGDFNLKDFLPGFPSTQFTKFMKMCSSEYNLFGCFKFFRAICAERMFNYIAVHRAKIASFERKIRQVSKDRSCAQLFVTLVQFPHRRFLNTWFTFPHSSSHLSFYLTD